MSAYVGIFRTKEEIEKALVNIAGIKERYKQIKVSSPKLHMNYELMNALELSTCLK